VASKSTLALLAMVLVLAGCGGGGGDASSPSASGMSSPQGSGTPSGGNSGSGGGSSTGSSSGGSVAAYTPCVAGTPTPGFSATGLTGDTGADYPACTANFAFGSAVVVGNGVTAANASDHFYGQYGVEYTVVIDNGANLISLFDNSGETGDPAEPPLTSASDTPEGEVIAFSYGSLTNNGTLNTFPLLAADSNNNYKKGAAVVYIANDANHPSSIQNNGIIGDNNVSSKSDAHYDYGQENSDGIYMQGGSIVNAAAGVINGYNAVFTRNTGTLDNYGVIVGVNDGTLSGYVVVNHLNASLSTNQAGFACAHAYANLTNYGYMLGNDYCVLAEGDGTVITDYGGPPVDGVKNFDASQVYNGEISSLIRGPETPNSAGPYATADAIMLDATGMTVNLISTTSNGVLYLPCIVGPMEGGFNGSFASATRSGKNTLNLQLDGISVAEATALQQAITASKTSNGNGTYFSGSFTMSNGFTYQWEDFALVQYTGTPQ